MLFKVLKARKESAESAVPTRDHRLFSRISSSVVERRINLAVKRLTTVRCAVQSVVSTSSFDLCRLEEGRGHSLV